MQVSIILNGAIPNKAWLRKCLKGTLIAADGGANVCKKYGITPAYLVGDFDSVSKSTLALFSKKTRILKDENQDETDFQKALRVADDIGATQIAVFGGFGKDLDHEFANLLSLPEHAVMYGESSSARVSARRVGLSVPVGAVVSVIAISDVASLSYSGLEWQAPKGKLRAGWIGIRNRAVKSKIVLSPIKGRIAVIVHTI